MSVELLGILTLCGTIVVSFILGARIMSAATDRLTASVNTLSTSVDTAISELEKARAGTDDAAVNAAADQIDAITAKLTAASTPPA